MADITVDTAAIVQARLWYTSIDLALQTNTRSTISRRSELALYATVPGHDDSGYNFPCLAVRLGLRLRQCQAADWLTMVMKSGWLDVLDTAKELAWCLDHTPSA